MSKYFQKISFRIWLPFALALSILMGIFALYYPGEQEKLFRENKERELRELAKTVALGVELSLNANDYKGLKKTVDLASSTTDFEFVSIINEDSITKKESVFISYPEKSENEILQKNTDLYVYEKYPFKANTFSGSILIAVSKAKINQLVYNLNKPLYIVMPLALLISLFFFFFLARRISGPILGLTAIAKELETQNYQVSIPESNQKDEINDLRIAFSSLRDSLLEQKQKNEKLTAGLEDEIKLRTSDLQLAQEKLIEAQRVARLGHYSFNFLTNTWESSEVLNEIYGIDDQFQKNMESWTTIVSPEQRKEMVKYFQDIVNDKKRFDKDYKIIRQNDGEERWVSGLGELRFDLSGNVISISGTIQDITERKKIEEEVNRLSLVARNTSNCVVITDPERRIQWVNESLIKLSGYSFDEIVGNYPRMFQFEKTDQQTVAFIREKLKNHEPVNAELLNIGKTGNEYWLDLNIVPIIGQDNVLSGYIAVETDITERKKADEALKRSEEELKKINETLEQKVLENTKKNLDLSKSIVEQEKLATIGEISAGIAHDLNTPLGAIKVGTESVQFTFETIMRDLVSKCTVEQKEMALQFSKNRKIEVFIGGLQLLKERKEMLASLESDYVGKIDRLPLIAEMLVKCRIQPQERDIISTILSWNNPVDVLELFYNVQIICSLLETIKTSVDKATKVVKDIRSFIKTETSVDRGRVNLHDNIFTVLSIFNYELKRNIHLDFEVDEKILIEGYDIKLFQLWSNLIKNAIEAMEDYPDKKIVVKSVLRDKEIDILVQNTGPEIPEEIIDKIFKKFFSTKLRKNGTGLGLSIVKNIVDEHGARISVHSADGLTTFVVTFKDPIIL
jgi:PAS domain S-box-containing protein